VIQVGSAVEMVTTGSVPATTTRQLTADGRIGTSRPTDITEYNLANVKPAAHYILHDKLHYVCSENTYILLRYICSVLK